MLAECVRLDFNFFFCRFLFCGLLFFQILWHFCFFNLLLKAYWACFYENFLILGLFFRICLPAFLLNFLAEFFVLLIFHANGCWACFSVKWPVFGLFFKVACFCKITWHHCSTPMPHPFVYLRCVPSDEIYLSLRQSFGCHVSCWVKDVMSENVFMRFISMAGFDMFHQLFDMFWND